MTPSPSTSEPSVQAVVAGADRCVQCGLCLPACPTYGLLREEADSPRGRVALARALAAGELPAEPTLTTHLGRCLLCRACESACPAGVPFGAIMDGARALTRRAGAPAASAPLRHLLDRPRLLRAGVRLLRLAQATGLTRLMAALPLAPARWRALVAALTRPAPPARLAGRRAGPEAGSPVWLFPGCTGEALDARTATDTLAALAALGFRVRVPEAHLCCGALHLHAGLPDEARDRASACAAALGTDEAPVLAIASGCALQLAELNRLGQPALAARAQELTSFLARIPWPHAPALRPLGLKVLLHVPCTLRHGLHQPGAVRALLARIPGLTLIETEGLPACCGAAGAYLFEEPALSDALREPWAHVLEQHRPDVIATPNLGCAFQLQAAAHEARVSLEVLHPVSLLARALQP